MMKKTLSRWLVTAGGVAAAMHLAGAVAAADKLDTASIQSIIGLKGAMSEAEGVYKVMSPRNDVKIAVDHWVMPPFMGLTSWAGFQTDPKQGAMVMGDLVLFQDEVNPVMSALLDNGLSVTALHNHFFFDEPKVYFMHIAGEGSVETLATGVRKAFDTVKRIRAANPTLATSFGGPKRPETNSLTAKPLETIFGVTGQSKDGMFKVVIGRKTTMDCGCEVGAEMGVNTWAAFAGSDDNAIVDGDFAVHENELQSALKTLRHSGINIVAIHSHMTGDTPRTLFLHYWGIGPAKGLAEAVRGTMNELGNASQDAPKR
jgi:hypothetical protein